MLSFNLVRNQCFKKKKPIIKYLFFGWRMGIGKYKILKKVGYYVSWELPL